MFERAWLGRIGLPQFGLGSGTEELREMLEMLRAQLDQGTTRQIGDSGGNGSGSPRVAGLSLLRNGNYGHSFQSWYPKPILPRDADYECGWWYCHPTTENTPMYKDRTGLGTFDTGYFTMFGADSRLINSLVADTGVFSLTGNRLTRVTDAVSGSYALAGSSATLTKSP